MRILLGLSPLLSFLFFILSGIYYLKLKKIKGEIKLIDKTDKKELAKDYKKALMMHLITGYASMTEALIHVAVKFHCIRLSLSWFLVLLYLMIICSGIYGKHLRGIPFLNKYWKKFHGFISILALILTVVHALHPRI